MSIQVALQWSGGKDSAFSFYLLQQNPNFRVSLLITTISAQSKKTFIHELPENLIQKQAQSLKLPLYKIYLQNNSNAEYEKQMLQVLKKLKEQGIQKIASGDIFLEDVRKYKEHLFANAGLGGIFPLWKVNTQQIIFSFLKEGFQAIVCSTNNKILSEKLLGKKLAQELLQDLPKGIDPCGENGEYHTFCFDGPIFSVPISFSIGSKRTQWLSLSEKSPAYKIWYVELK